MVLGFGDHPFCSSTLVRFLSTVALSLGGKGNFSNFCRMMMEFTNKAMKKLGVVVNRRVISSLRLRFEFSFLCRS